MRTMFYISDRTAITAETIGHSLLAQFAGTTDYREVTIPYVDSLEKAAQVVERINAAALEDGARPIVFSTLAEPESRRVIIQSDAHVLDLFHVFLEPIERALDAKPLITRTRSHRISNLSSYESRIGAIDFSLQHDDGARIKDYDKADLIMVGVSRSGKTPTCLYLAMQFGIRAANYPITEEDFESDTLPEPVRPYFEKVHGLTIDPKRLASIREERRPGSRYASVEQCRIEVRKAESLFRSLDIPFINTTSTSVEEIATRVVQTRGLERHAV
ncbi:MAG TPA: pyruvate, water dikinase regulatory protein [Vicinamibacteria bacterium]|nr:pyruvate, water dikinase regulatory protein [Vicinamibacteria bacterium]